MGIEVRSAPGAGVTAAVSYGAGIGKARTEIEQKRLLANQQKLTMGARNKFQTERDEADFQRRKELYQMKSDAEKQSDRDRRSEYDSKLKQIEDAYAGGGGKITPKQHNDAMERLEKQYGDIASPWFAEVAKEEPQMWNASDGAQVPMPMKDGVPQPFEAYKEWGKQQAAKRSDESKRMAEAWKIAVDNSKNPETGIANMDKAQKIFNRIVGARQETEQAVEGPQDLQELLPDQDGPIPEESKGFMVRDHEGQLPDPVIAGPAEQREHDGQLPDEIVKREQAQGNAGRPGDGSVGGSGQVYTEERISQIMDAGNFSPAKREKVDKAFRWFKAARDKKLPLTEIVKRLNNLEEHIDGR